MMRRPDGRGAIIPTPETAPRRNAGGTDRGRPAAHGAAPASHDNPSEATVQVLHGRVRMISGTPSCEARTRDLLIVPDARHSLEALEDSAVLLSVAKLP
jgi:hypothetical protein